jgi:hypothetical protein
MALLRPKIQAELTPEVKKKNRLQELKANM